MPKEAKTPPGWTLPVTPIPARGESWRSFLRRVAALNDTTVSRLVEACGLVDDDILSPAQRCHAAHLACLDDDEVRAMTLNAWTGTALPVEPSATSNRQGPAWTWLAPTFRCTACLKQGVELLEWRLPWITTCELHQAYLSSGGRAVPALAEDLGIGALHRSRLRSGQADGHFDTWRDAVRLAIGLRRCPPMRCNSLAADRALLMAVAAPLATADSAEERADVLAAWCAAAGVRMVWDSLRHRLRSRALIDAADALAARAWIRRRVPVAAVG